jgi:hypothetical protein
MMSDFIDKLERARDSQKQVCLMCGKNMEENGCHEITPDPNVPWEILGVCASCAAAFKKNRN